MATRHHATIGGEPLEAQPPSGPTSGLLDQLRRALVARYGPDLGQEAHAEAAAYAVANWGRISGMEHPVRYLYRVGQSRLRRHFPTRQPAFATPPPRHAEPGAWIEPELANALAALTEQQRVCLLLVVADEWTMSEVADLLDISKASVQTHVDRAKRSIRNHLGVDDG